MVDGIGLMLVQMVIGGYGIMVMADMEQVVEQPPVHCSGSGYFTVKYNPSNNYEQSLLGQFPLNKKKKVVCVMFM